MAEDISFCLDMYENIDTNAVDFLATQDTP